MDRLATLDQARSRRIVLAALGLGILGDAVLDGPTFGINVPLVLVAILAAAWLVRRPGRVLDPVDAWLPLATVVLAGMVAIRGDAFLAVLDTAAAIALCAATVLAWSGIAVTRRSASVIAALGAWVWATIFVGALTVLQVARPEPRVRWRQDAATLEAVARGLVIGIPLAGIFAVLFASADPVFRDRLSDVVGLRLDLGDLPGRVVLILSGAWLAAGLLSVAAGGVPDVEYPSLGAATRTPVLSRVRLGTPEALVILLAIDIVVGLFVLLQIAYLFPGAANFAQAGLTYATYARRGFFELVAAACLAAAVVVVLEAVVTVRTRAYLVALLGLIGLTAIVLVSAVQRLDAYQVAYGWTELRFYVLTSIVTMGAGLVVMAGLVIAGYSRWLPHGLAALGIVGLVVLNLLTPSAFVAERNLDRAIHPESVPADGHDGLDADYLSVLPDDAIPAMVAALPALPPSDRARVLAILEDRRLVLATDPAALSPFAWNVGREAARAALGTLP
jgi:Domain of unknown function (DUF4173)